MFDEFLERHFQAWLDSAVCSDEDRTDVENGIRKYLKANPEDIGMSWPSIRKDAFDQGYIKDETIVNSWAY